MTFAEGGCSANLPVIGSIKVLSHLDGVSCTERWDTEALEEDMWSLREVGGKIDRYERFSRIDDRMYVV